MLKIKSTLLTLGVRRDFSNLSINIQNLQQVSARRSSKETKRCSHYGLGTLNSVAPGLHGGDVVSDLNLLHDDSRHLDGDLARNHLNLQRNKR